MTDQIILARKKWCDPRVIKIHPSHHESCLWIDPCPPEVVAALLDVLIDSAGTAYCGVCGKLAHMKEHDPRCCVGIAEAAITHALEGKLCS